MKLFWVVFFVLMFISLAPVAYAGTWIWDFNNGKVNDWNEVVGKWKAEKGGYAEVAGTEYAKTLWGNVNWTNYTVEVGITLQKEVGFNCAGLLVRTNDDGTQGFRFWIRTDEWKCQFSKWVDNKFVHIVEKHIIDVKIGVTYNLKVIIEGNRYQCFADGDLVIDHEDKEKVRENGKIGFITYQAYPLFDNLIISGPNIPSSAVDPGAKLTQSWGKIKSQ